MHKRCVICNSVFLAPPSSKKITCSSPVCSRQRKQESHRGKHPQWNAASRARLAERGQTENLQQGTKAAQRSPLAGPFETNQEAKLWWIVSTDGTYRYHVRNLRKFCRDHPDLFSPDLWEHAYAGLKQVQASLMGKTPRRVRRWKGWTLEQAAKHPSDVP